MDYIDQMMADIGHGAELIIWRDARNGNVFRGYIYDSGPLQNVILEVEAPYVELVIAQLDDKAEEWLRREQP